MIISTMAISIIIVYLITIGLLSFGFDKVEDVMLSDIKPKTKFSIIVPFRNEAENLPKLLKSISELNYPKSLFEIIFVDDASEDDSVNSIQKISDTKIPEEDFNQIENIIIIQNKRISPSPKKDAITSAIEIAKNEWIITTDADCLIPKYWLDAFDEFIQLHKVNCIVAPVTYTNNSSFFNQFQTLDFLSLQGATIGGFGLKNPFLCNGANFAYRLEAFKKVKGFKGNTNIASGDDVFLLEKFLKQDSAKVKYLKSEKAIVKTQPAKSISELIHQRIRWASKTSAYDSWTGKIIGLIVFLGNTLCLAFIPLVLLNLLGLRAALALFVVKFSIDFLLLFKASRFFKQEKRLLSYIFSSLIYPIFNCYVALLSLFKSYTWKGRNFKK